MYLSKGLSSPTKKSDANVGVTGVGGCAHERAWVGWPYLQFSSTTASRRFGSDAQGSLYASFGVIPGPILIELPLGGAMLKGDVQGTLMLGNKTECWRSTTSIATSRHWLLIRWANYGRPHKGIRVSTDSMKVPLLGVVFRRVSSSLPGSLLCFRVFAPLFFRCGTPLVPLQDSVSKGRIQAVSRFV